MAKAPATPIAVSNPYFKLLLGINVAMWLFTGVVMLCFSIWGPVPLNKTQERYFGICEYVFMITTGVFTGLLGGRAGTPDRLMPT
jgi:hypothetical protein